MKIGFVGSCQLILCYNFFLNPTIQQSNNYVIKFALPFYIYDNNDQHSIDYTIFDDLDVLVLETNNLNNCASSNKITNYCVNKNANIKIIKTFLVKFPIYPINWSGYGENKQDYINWIDINKIDFNSKFEKCMLSLIENNKRSDLNLEISNFVKCNFNKKLLFTHSLHPTNVLLYVIWKYILYHLNINIDDYKYEFNGELINCWYNPFTNKMISDLNIEILALNHQ